MYLSELLIENFRIFGAEERGQHLHLKLRPGLNVLVGENDSGKSAIVDAIRHVLWTTSMEYHWLTEDDFHVSGSQRATNLTIRCTFRDLSRRESARFLEWLSVDEGKPCLYITLRAKRMDENAASTSRRRNIAITVRAGKKGEGRALEGEIRLFLRTTYLRPLRDAEAELSAGRGSRLSQILQAHPGFSVQGASDYDENEPSSSPSTLVGIMRQAEHLIQENPIIQGTKRNLNEQYLQSFSIGRDVLQGEIGVARRAELRHILEKLDLWLSPREATDLRVQRGLGVNNVLFMATELLLLGGDEQGALPLLLIEEPEAHLHPQMQLRLMDFLEGKASGNGGNPIQILVTTHSPNLVSTVDLKSVVVMHEGQAYSLASECTRLEPSDYRFLQRFLDVTKANLFFAKGVMIVEGDAENILLPTLARLVGCSFSEHGVSIVNVGSRGLFRYSRIFQRKDDQVMPIQVTCVADRDIVPDAANYVTSRKESEYTDDEIDKHTQKLTEKDGGGVKTFVSPKWTLEYDLAYCGLAFPVHVAIQLAKRAKGSGYLSDEDKCKVVREAALTFRTWRKEGLTREELAARVFEPLYKRQASKTEVAQFMAERMEVSRFSVNAMRLKLPSYLVEAIDHVTGCANDKKGQYATPD